MLIAELIHKNSINISQMNIVTRFAPSPTGFLHIGGARTALFNWLFAKHHQGKFFLRIEDTDKKRSTKDAIDAILDGLTWLGLNWDGEVVYQSKNFARHSKMVLKLIENGMAYRCYCTSDELQKMREKARSDGLQPRYDGRWRDRDPSDAPANIAPSIRFKAPRSGSTSIEDAVQGLVRVDNQQLDDMVIMRSDGTPTYTLSVVVDDHDMGVSHIIRGDDHLTNAFRQAQLYRALDWQVPKFAHIPLIHGADGSKMSKRDGSLGIESYADMGFIASAMQNYLLRLGWSHGDEEIIDLAQAIKWFDLPDIGRAPSRFDIKKLESLNAHYLRNLEDKKLLTLIEPFTAEQLGRKLKEEDRNRLLSAMDSLKPRVKTLIELADNSMFYVAQRPITIGAKAALSLEGVGRKHLSELIGILDGVAQWDSKSIETLVRIYTDSHSVKLGAVAQPLRAALTGSAVSPGIFEVMESLGREETLARLRDIER